MSEAKPMRILVACEYSGRVRDAFRAQGHDAVSCDLLPSDVPGPHRQGDVLSLLDDGWDMLIAFPHARTCAAPGFTGTSADPNARQRPKKHWRSCVLCSMRRLRGSHWRIPSVVSRRGSDGQTRSFTPTSTARMRASAPVCG